MLIVPVRKTAAQSNDWLQLGIFPQLAENIEEFIQPALSESDPDPVLISDTDPTQIFSARSTPNNQPVDMF